MARPLLPLATLLMLFCASGAHCVQQMGPAWPYSSVAQAPRLLPPGPSLDQVIEVVNNNTDRVTSLSTSNAVIRSPMIPTSLRGNIALERPHKFRLVASLALTGPEVDLGSNDELFWVWIHRNQPPAVYFCRHEQFYQSAAREQMPIEPKWLIEAIGLPRFDPRAVHDGPKLNPDGTLEIYSTLPLPVTGSPLGAVAQNRQLNKVTVVDAQRGWVLEQHIYLDRTKLLASSLARDHRYDPTTGVSLPQHVTIHMYDTRSPNGQITLEIDLGDVVINSVGGNPDQLWTMPTFPGSPPVDLGRLAPQQPRTAARPVLPQMDLRRVDRQWSGARRRRY